MIHSPLQYICQSMANKKIYSSSWRQRKAYWTALKVMWSYTKLYLLSKLFGKAYYQSRVVDLHLKNALLVKKSILKLEGLFIKVGQLLSILTNFLPEAFHEPLEGLQDQIPARPYDEIERRIQKEFGKGPKDLFMSFSEVPIASASIGQAHRAELKDGTSVVIKVQHENIEKVAEVDLKIIKQLTRLASWFFEINGMEHAYTQVKKMIEEELDFKRELEAMETIRGNLSAEQQFTIPRAHTDFCTERVLCTTFHEGVKISDVQQLKDWGIDQRDLAERLVHAYCQMVFVDGHYHADPHPGNILIEKTGRIVLLDFGAVATLSPEMRTGLLNLIEGAAKNDSEKIIDSLQVMDFIANGNDAERIAERIIDAFRNFLQNEVQFDGLNFKDIKVNPFETSLYGLLSDIGLSNITSAVQVPKEYILLNRMITLLLGICNTLDSQMNPLKVVRPYFQEFMLGEQGDIVGFVTQLLQRTFSDVFSLPGEFRKVLNKAKRGKLEIQLVGERDRTQLMFYFGQQLVFSLLLIAALAFSWQLHVSSEFDLRNWGLGIAGVLLFLLLRSMRRAGRVRRRLG